MCQKISIEVNELFIPHYDAEIKSQNEAAAVTARDEAQRLAVIAAETGSKDDLVASEEAEIKAKKAEAVQRCNPLTTKRRKACFKGILLNECQRVFQTGLDQISDETKTSIELEELRSAQKRRMLGNIRFIGELYIRGMVIEIIIHSCVQHLLKDPQNPSDEDLEALCKLLITIGKQLDNPRSKRQMDAYFLQIQIILTQITLTSRIRYMLLDLQDLRKNQWTPREAKTK